MEKFGKIRIEENNPLTQEEINAIKNLKSVCFCNDYNQPIDGDILEGVDEIMISFGFFNQPLDNLPKSLKSLTIYSHKFNHSLDNLPENLEYLIMAGKYNKPLDFLPSNLKELHLLGMYNFNQPLDNLPSNLEKLIISAPYKHSLDNLPDSLSYFNYSGFKKLSMKRVPQNLKKIKVNLGYGKIELDNVIVEYY